MSEHEGNFNFSACFNKIALLEKRKKEIISLTETLIEGISKCNYELYSQLCDRNMTCFEPESNGNLISGLQFHKFYFDNLWGKLSAKCNTTIVNPVVHLLGEDSACIAYIRLLQILDKEESPQTMQWEETRIWTRKNNKWQCVHMHRSKASDIKYNINVLDVSTSDFLLLIQTRSLFFF
ncbi:Calcium/calmodulin-dependent protein kinase type II alpha chain-like protein [Dinothrombium tinctorium]|uniref:Calcium/calmodulin-dependent protein kinase type II alpha chain-like protein n=1 Tax=Dinothrombium tinctorium TaxID=1965070 RepID=A0A443R2G3_9ACAR|nr:Calcium/calmodulin-dependent protein kinase type II alpha chain-like protein [Dinothrombium tinctorium]